MVKYKMTFERFLSYILIAIFLIVFAEIEEKQGNIKYGKSYVLAILLGIVAAEVATK